MTGYYKYWFRGHGEQVVKCNLGKDNVNANSIVVCSITELQPNAREDTFTGSKWPATLGLARMSVLNVTPTNEGEIHTRVNVDWGDPLDFQLSFIVA
jgi:hypothetical protein